MVYPLPVSQKSIPFVVYHLPVSQMSIPFVGYHLPVSQCTLCSLPLPRSISLVCTFCCVLLAFILCQWVYFYGVPLACTLCLYLKSVCVCVFFFCGVHFVFIHCRCFQWVYFWGCTFCLYPSPSVFTLCKFLKQAYRD